MRYLNFTPHPISIHCHNGIMTLQPTGPAPRRAPRCEDLGERDGITFVATTLGVVEGLPSGEPDTIIIVSALVAEGADERADLAYPGEAIRDETGRVIGARGLCAGPGLARRLRLESLDLSEADLSELCELARWRYDDRFDELSIGGTPVWRVVAPDGREWTGHTDMAETAPRGALYDAIRGALPYP